MHYLVDSSFFTHFFNYFECFLFRNTPSKTIINKMIRKFTNPYMCFFR